MTAGSTRFSDEAELTAMRQLVMGHANIDARQRW
jgi:hypothetical protein